ncbi:hypothetical protein U0C82_02615 [Fulvimarina sp. 2208YS6-2-32]|uniref:DUF4760 domain-containing protein n=1 Tax=Fulvimarina uroteuthidis TaxID=3098149 RepID=A0ABU5HYS3_9HYPH|nr:hypothetical protein [Fulvimarina sp. 2208YS6-2-32]
MDIPWSNIFDFVETITLVGGAIFAVITIKKNSDSRNIDFILNSEQCLDPISLSLMEMDEPALRLALRSEIGDKYDYSEMIYYVYCRLNYEQISRMFYLANNRNIDIGMNESERNEYIEIWNNYLMKFRGDVYMREVHKNAMFNQDFNIKFLKNADAILSSDK